MQIIKIIHTFAQIRNGSYVHALNIVLIPMSQMLSKGDYLAMKVIAPKHTFVVTPSLGCRTMKKKIDVVLLKKLKEKITPMFYVYLIQ